MRTTKGTSRIVAALAVAAFVAAPSGALGYGGPGSVVTGLGALLAVVAAVIAAIFGFLWFPVKRLYRKIRGPKPKDDAREIPDAPA